MQAGKVPCHMEHLLPHVGNEAFVFAQNMVRPSLENPDVNLYFHIVHCLFFCFLTAEQLRACVAKWIENPHTI